MDWEWRFPGTDQLSTSEDKPQRARAEFTKILPSSSQIAGTSFALTPSENVREIRWRCNMTRKLLPIVIVLSVWSGTQAFGAERKDLQIANDVSKAVNRYPNFTIFDDLTVAVRDGVVTLDGKVTMPYKRDAIEKRVAHVEGVKDVRNRIGVLPVSLDDDALRARIARSIYGNSNFWNYAVMPNPPIHIIVEHGRVTLTGVVQSDVDRMLARSLATNFRAFSVTNNLKTDAEVRGQLEKSE
jgi:osmotically-inducible protein OsmY